MDVVFIIKGRKVKVEGLGSRERKRELAEKFIRYKEDVEQFLRFDEKEALKEIRKKAKYLVECDYEIEVVNSSDDFAGKHDMTASILPDFDVFVKKMDIVLADAVKKAKEHYHPENKSDPISQLFDLPFDFDYFQQLFDENMRKAEMEFLKEDPQKLVVHKNKFIFNINGERVISRLAIYHEITHYIVRLNLLKENPDKFHKFLNSAGSFSYISFINEGFAEFVSRYLTGRFVETPRIIPLNVERDLYLMYEKGFEEVKEWFITLGRDPKKLLEAVTRRILDSL